MEMGDTGNALLCALGVERQDKLLCPGNTYLPQPAATSLTFELCVELSSRAQVALLSVTDMFSFC